MARLAYPVFPSICITWSSVVFFRLSLLHWSALFKIKTKIEMKKKMGVHSQTYHSVNRSQRARCLSSSGVPKDLGRAGKVWPRGGTCLWLTVQSIRAHLQVLMEVRVLKKRSPHMWVTSRGGRRKSLALTDRLWIPGWACSSGVRRSLESGIVFSTFFFHLCVGWW